MKRALVTIAACVLTFCVARLTVSSSLEQQPAPPQSAPSRQVVRPATTAQHGITADEVRRILREERGSADAPRADEPAAEPTEHGTRALALVDNAISRRTWTDRDRDELRRLLASTSGVEADAVLSKLALAINAGNLQVESVPL